MGQFVGLERNENEQIHTFDEEYKVVGYEVSTGLEYPRIYEKGTQCKYLGKRTVEVSPGLAQEVNTYEITTGKYAGDTLNLPLGADGFII